MTPSDAVLSLVDSVGRLRDEDQDRILKVVRLLSQASEGAQQHSKYMIREMLSSHPENRLDCVAELEDIIEYLESSLLPAAGVASPAFGSPRTLS